MKSKQHREGQASSGKNNFTRQRKVGRLVAFHLTSLDLPARLVRAGEAEAEGQDTEAADSCRHVVVGVAGFDEEVREDKRGEVRRAACVEVRKGPRAC